MLLSLELELEVVVAVIVLRPATTTITTEVIPTAITTTPQPIQINNNLPTTIILAVQHLPPILTSVAYR